jgi:hypothetical protein
MSEQKYADRRILLCVVALFAATAVHAATKDAATKHAATRMTASKNAATKIPAAKNVVIKDAVTKNTATKNAATKTAAAKKAGAKNAGVKKLAAPPAPLAISLPRLAGRWKGDTSGMEVQIEQGSIGWEVWLSTDGQARITQPEADPQIIKIQSRNLTCTYSVTVPAAQTMKWEMTPGQPDSRCLEDSFTKLGSAPQRGRPVAAMKPAAQSKPPVGNGRQP